MPGDDYKEQMLKKCQGVIDIDENNALDYDECVNDTIRNTEYTENGIDSNILLNMYKEK